MGNCTWLDTQYFEMTGKKIKTLEIDLLDAEKCDLEPQDPEHSEKMAPYKPMMYYNGNHTK